MRLHAPILLTIVLRVTLAPAGEVDPEQPRRVINLDGLWQVEQGGMEGMPAAFTHTVAVPGLLDMARPAFSDVGKPCTARRAFWYRRAFKVEGALPEVALLMIHKARYGTRVMLNGKDLGEHLPCFTPAYFDVKPYLKGEGAENVLIIRVGANPDCLPTDMPRGWDFEKYLYEMTVTTGGDAVKVRFGMRSFRFDAQSGRAVLNGKPYFLRGTNICIYRFFEDQQRGDLPWRADWTRRLHQQFKSMHWNSIRYCIGFPPDFWYDIADEEGLLIQDEFPIWLLNPQPGKDGAPEFPRAEKIIPEYIDWMRQRWNHPCVVIWDGQNESFTDETGKAIRAVRHLDLSGRPWENGWSEPQSTADCVESHPYLFSRGWQGQGPFKLSEMPRVSGVPYLNDRQKKLRVPIIINEYLSTRSVRCHVKGFGREVLTINQEIPADEGAYRLVAELSSGPGTPVRSLRDFKVLPRSGAP
ncbi:MAG: glycoside hydrolase family 2 TIM barrel-domain containing protein [Isosphaerales bacterium]